MIFRSAGGAYAGNVGRGASGNKNKNKRKRRELRAVRHDARGTEIVQIVCCKMEK
jgi:hypothetical protein